MSDSPSSRRLSAFREHRPELVALAYRMLGDVGRAEDVVQEAWLRWEDSGAEPDAPRAYLVTIVTRLSLNELSSARARKEESRPDRLPEPIDLGENELARIDRLEQVSMAFLFLLQRLDPAERAVFLLHEVFELEHTEIADVIGKTAPACRKLLERARERLAVGRKVRTPEPEEHRRLLRAFLAAASEGDAGALTSLLAHDAVMITDGGPHGRSIGGQRNLPAPLVGAERIAAFVSSATTRRRGSLRAEERELNGQPAIVFWAGDEIFSAMLLDVVDGHIARVFFHADLDRLSHVRGRAC